jgi:acetyltransferase-like isoleucine patch superfamily enzyme
MNAYFYNPLSIYLRYLWNRFQNQRRFQNFDQAYMAVVKRTFCEPNVRVGSESLITESRIGAYSYVSHDTEIFGTQIGKFCSVGPGCRLGVGIHPTDHISTSPVFFSTKKQAGISFVSTDVIKENKDIKIGNDVWIGANAVILDGVEIGTGAIIAAGAVVTKNVAPYTIVAGVPALSKRKRFSDEQIECLLRSCWWNWPTDILLKYAAEFSHASQFINEVLMRNDKTPKD